MSEQDKNNRKDAFWAAVTENEGIMPPCQAFDEAFEEFGLSQKDLDLILGED